VGLGGGGIALRWGRGEKKGGWSLQVAWQRAKPACPKKRQVGKEIGRGGGGPWGKGEAEKKGRGVFKQGGHGEGEGPKKEGNGREKTKRKVTSL